MVYFQTQKKAYLSTRFFSFSFSFSFSFFLSFCFFFLGCFRKRVGWFAQKQLLYAPPLMDSVPKSDVTRDDSQRRFLAQHCVAMLEQCYICSKQYRNNVATIQNNVATMSLCCVALTIVVANRSV